MKTWENPDLELQECDSESKVVPPCPRHVFPPLNQHLHDLHCLSPATLQLESLQALVLVTWLLLISFADVFETLNCDVLETSMGDLPSFLFESHLWFHLDPRHH